MEIQYSFFNNTRLFSAQLFRLVIRHYQCQGCCLLLSVPLFGSIMSHSETFCSTSIECVSRCFNESILYYKYTRIYIYQRQYHWYRRGNNTIVG